MCVYVIYNVYIYTHTHNHIARFLNSNLHISPNMLILLNKYINSLTSSKSKDTVE